MSGVRARHAMPVPASARALGPPSLPEPAPSAGQREGEHKPSAVKKGDIAATATALAPPHAGPRAPDASGTRFESAVVADPWGAMCVDGSASLSRPASAGADNGVSVTGAAASSAVDAGGNEKQMSRGHAVRSLFLWLFRADGAAAPGPAVPRVWKGTDTLSDVIDAAVAEDADLANVVDDWKSKVGGMKVKAWRALSIQEKRELGFSAALIGAIKAELNPAAAAAAAPASGASSLLIFWPCHPGRFSSRSRLVWCMCADVTSLCVMCRHCAGPHVAAA